MDHVEIAVAVRDVVQARGTKRTWRADDTETTFLEAQPNLSHYASVRENFLRAGAHTTRCTVTRCGRSGGDILAKLPAADRLFGNQIFLCCSQADSRRSCRIHSLTLLCLRTRSSPLDVRRLHDVITHAGMLVYSRLRLVACHFQHCWHTCKSLPAI